MKHSRILLLDFNPSDELSHTLQAILKSSERLPIQSRRESVTFDGLAACDRHLSPSILTFQPDMIFLVSFLSLPMHAQTILSFLSNKFSGRPIVIVTEVGGPDELFELLKLGVADVITPPLTTLNILPRIWHLLQQRPPGEAFARTMKDKLGLGQLVGESPAFLAEVEKIPLIAQCDASVLISGETGTGKELCARSIHYRSPRADNPFIPLNCGAIPEHLVENELFGHERGAFTSANTVQGGLIRSADKGTLFLDEIDCLSPAAQVKLLRFLQEKEYRPLGSSKLCKADVRIISASSINLEQGVKEGRLRQDLYYRLNVIPMLLPPLRERRMDIPLLVHYFLNKYTTEFNKSAMRVSHDALQKMIAYHWPGNVRELEHVVERAVLLCERAIIQSADLIIPGVETQAHSESFQKAKERIISEFEKTYIHGLLLIYQGNITRAARAAQKDRRAFWQLMRKHHITGQGFKPGSQ